MKRKREKMLLSTAPLMSMGWYCSPAPFKCMRLGCNTSHSLWTRMALQFFFLEESSHATFPPVSYMPFNGTTIRLQDCVNKPNPSMVHRGMTTTAATGVVTQLIQALERQAGCQPPCGKQHGGHVGCYSAFLDRTKEQLK